MQNNVTDAIRSILLANDKDVQDAKAAFDKDPSNKALEAALNDLYAQKAIPYLIQNTLVQLQTIANLDYQKLLARANPLQQIASLEDVVKNLKVTGTLS